MKQYCIIRSVLFVFSTLIVSCSTDDTSSSIADHYHPGSLLRQVAGLPANLTDQRIIEEDYNVAIEEALASCMRSNGFDYFVRTNNSVEKTRSDRFDLPPDDFAEQYGFGIAHGVFAGLQVETEPNQRYVATLTPEQYDAYRVALDGEQALSTPAEIIEISGCRRTAIDTVDEPVWFSHSDWLSTVSMELFDRLDADPRIVDADQQWLECMQSSGYDDYSSAEDLSNLLNDEFIQIVASFQVQRTSSSSEDFLAALDEESLSAYETFRNKEIELAVVSRRCAKDHDELVAAVSREIEQSILNTYAIN